MALSWEYKYATGDETIDSQHRMLFDYVNRLEVQLHRDAIDRQTVEDVLKYMTLYATTHFVYEELCMNRHRCPVAQQNQDAHDKFMTLVDSFQRRFLHEGATRDLVQTIYDAAANWLVGHICKIDTQLRAYV